MKKLLIIFLLLAFSQIVKAKAAGGAKEPVENGLPYFLTVPVFPLAKDLYEIQIQPEYNCGRGEKELFLYTLASYGVTDDWQVYIDMYPYLIHTESGVDTSGFGDMDIGTQYSWMYINKSKWSTSFLFNIHIPTGDVTDNITDGFLRYEPSFLIAKDFVFKSWRTQLFTQLGLSIVQRLKKPTPPPDPTLFELEPAAHSFVWGSGVSLRFEKINYSLELNLYTNAWNNNGDDTELYLTPGVFMQVEKYVSVGFGLPIGLTGDSDHFDVILSILIDIPGPCAKQDNDNGKDKNGVSTVRSQRLMGEGSGSTLPSSRTPARHTSSRHANTAFQ